MIHAKTLALMTVTIASLGKFLTAECASKGAKALVCAHVVLHVAELGEGFTASQALKNLVLTTRRLVQMLHFSEPYDFYLVFGDGTPRALLNLPFLH